MKKINILLVLALGIVFTSCQKSSNTTSGGGGSSTSSTGFTNIYGTLSAERTLTNNTVTTIPDTSYSDIVYFFNTGQNNWVFWNASVTTPAGNVFLNSVKLKLYNFSGAYLYGDTTGTLNLKNNVSWQVTGTSPIPAFTYAPGLPWPSYTGYAQLPDTIHKTQNTTINLSGISSSDSVNITIDDGITAAGHTSTSPKFVATSSGITFLSSYTNGFTTTATGRLSISVYKFAPVQTFGGKNFVFLNNVQFKKTVYIK